MRIHFDGRNIKVGDTVTRMLAGTIPITLRVAEVTEDFIICGAWTFDRLTGVEEDADLGWGRAFGITGSFLQNPSAES